MVAAAGGNVERDVIFNLKAKVDAKSFQELSRFGKAATKIQTQIDKGVERSAKTRATIEGKAAQTAQRTREKAFAAEQKLLARGAKLIQKALDDRQKAAEKAAKAELKVREQAAKQLEKRQAEFVKNREKGLKAEQKSIKEATRQAEIFQKKGEAATKRFTAEIQKAAAGALLFARGLAFIGIASKEDLGKVVKAVIQVQGAFDILRGGERIIRSIIAAQKALAIATQAATVAQIAQNAAQAAGGVTGAAAAGGGFIGEAGVETVGGVAAGGVGRVAGAAGAAALAAPVAAIGVAAGVLVAGLALVNKDFRQKFGEFLGILESDTDRLARVLQQKANLDQRDIAFRAKKLALETQDRERESRSFSRQLKLQVARGERTAAQATKEELKRARTEAPALQKRLEEVRRETGGQAAILAREEAAISGLRRAQAQRVEAQRGVVAVRARIGRRAPEREFDVKFTFQQNRQRAKAVDLEEKIVALDEQILKLEKASAPAIQKATAETNKLLAATNNLERNQERINSLTLISIDQAKQAGEEVLRGAEKQIAAQLKAVDAAKQLLKVRESETKELKKQRESIEEQFGLLTKREQRRKVRIVRKLIAGEDISLRQLREVGRLQGPAEAARQEALRRRGGAEVQEFLQQQGITQGIGRAEQREEGAREAFQREIKVAGELVAKIDLNFTIDGEEFREAFNSVIEPGIEKIRAAAEEILRMQIEEAAKGTNENNLNTQTQ